MTERRIFLLLCAAFIVTGVDCTMLGPALPTLAAAWHLRDVNSGVLLFVQPVAGIVASAVSTRNLYWSIVGGGTALVAGLLLFGTGRFAVAHVALALTGFGFGLLLVAGNIMAGLRAERLAGSGDPAVARSTAISIVNFCWGLGAIASGLAFHTFLVMGHPFAFFVTLAAGIAVVTILCAAWLPRDASGKKEDPQTMLPVSVRAIFAAAVFLYSGMEDGISGWLPTYTQRLLSAVGQSSAAALGAYAATVFFSAEMVGRLLMPAVLLRSTNRSLYRTALCLLLFTLVALIALPAAIHGRPTAATVITGSIALLAGLGVAPVYPILLSMMIGRSSTEHGLGWVFACGGLGGGLLPYLGGALSSASGAPLGIRWAFAVPAAAAVSLLLLTRRLVGKEVKSI